MSDATEPADPGRNAPTPTAAATPDVLASDAEREAIVERLSAACAEGRLPLGEFGERSARAVVARTRTDLASLVADLPPHREAGQTLSPAALVARGGVARRDAGDVDERHFSLLGAVARRGRWKVKPRTRVRSLIGGIDIDLSDALISDHDVTLAVTAIIGRVEVVAPKGVRVEVRASSPIGGRNIDVDDTGPGTPVIRVRAFSFLGGVEVRTKSEPSR